MNWTPELLRKFKQHYNKAASKGLSSFFFEGKLFAILYAKYLIEYLEPRL